MLTTLTFDFIKPNVTVKAKVNKVKENKKITCTLKTKWGKFCSNTNNFVMVGRTCNISKHVFFIIINFFLFKLSITVHRVV